LPEENKKTITEYTGEELVSEVIRTLTCPICGDEFTSPYEVYAHISEKHSPAPTVGVAS